MHADQQIYSLLINFMIYRVKCFLLSLHKLFSGMKKLIFGLVAISVMSCNFHDARKKDATEALSEANQALSSGHPDSSAVKEALVAVESFVKRFPEDSLSPSFLFELALVYEKQRQYDSALKTLDRVYSYYPRSKQAGKALFLEGFLYNELHQLDKAKEKYELYLKEYSANDAKMTNDAQMELQNLGKSPEEILNEIQEKAKQDSIQAHGPSSPGK